MRSLERGALVAGRYRLERPLAAGGMGGGWGGRHLQLHVHRALKFLTTALAEAAGAPSRFEHEAKASALLKVSNAVHIYDYGVEEGTPFIVTELREGEDLKARLKREKRLAPSALVPSPDQRCRALRRADEVGLVHRGLKPS